MKKIINLFFLIFSFFFSSFLLVGCEDLFKAFDELTHKHDLYLVEYVPATCQNEGIREHYACRSCDDIFEDAEGKKEILGFVNIQHRGHTKVQTIISEPTCVDEGIIHYLCEWCNEIQEIEIIKALGHVYEDDWITIESTCSKEGSSSRKCKRCGLEEKEILPLKEHNYGSYTYDILATCFKEGEKSKICKDCGFKKIEVIAKLSHQREYIPELKPTCVNSGHNSGYKCKLCNTMISGGEILEPLDHDFIHKELTTVSCSIDGNTEGEICSRCGIVLWGYEITPMLGHDLKYFSKVPSTCTVHGTSAGYKCIRENCTYTQGVEYLPLAEHIAIIDPKVEPLCSKTGLSEGSHCKICGKIIVVQEIIPTSHKITYIYKNESEHYTNCINPDINCDYKSISLAHKYDIDGNCLCGDVAPAVGLEFIEESHSCKLIGLGSWEGEILKIPSEFNGLPVVEIAEYAINSPNISKIIIPSTLTTMSRRSFEGCINLENIYFDSLDTLLNLNILDSSSGSGALYLPKNLYVNNKLVTNIIIPEGIEKINAYAFDGYSSITSIKLPTSLLEIGSYAFRDNSLVQIDIPSSVEIIGVGAFYSNDKLTTVKLNEGLKELRSESFAYCKSLKSITIPNSLTAYNIVFYGCDSLETLIVPFITNKLGGWFGGSNETVPDSLKYLEMGGNVASEAFYLGCPEKVVIKEGATKIGARAFQAAGRLKEVVIPNSVTTIEDDIFIFCTNLNKITIPYIGKTKTDLRTLSYFFSYLSRDNDEFYQDIPKALKEIVITSATSIKEYSFFKCSGIEKVTIPETITSIGKYAFSGCNGLTNVNFLGTTKWSVNGTFVYVYTDETAIANLTINYRGYEWIAA